VGVGRGENNVFGKTVIRCVCDVHISFEKVSNILKGYCRGLSGVSRVRGHGSEAPIDISGILDLWPTNRLRHGKRKEEAALLRVI
jgi:hypothetical protein